MENIQIYVDYRSTKKFRILHTIPFIAVSLEMTVEPAPFIPHSLAGRQNFSSSGSGRLARVRSLDGARRRVKRPQYTTQSTGRRSQYCAVARDSGNNRSSSLSGTVYRLLQQDFRSILPGLRITPGIAGTCGNFQMYFFTVSSKNRACKYL
jgi:hypothetical protein